jgi:hypothetical protein
MAARTRTKKLSRRCARVQALQMERSTNLNGGLVAPLGIVSDSSLGGVSTDCASDVDLRHHFYRESER